MLERTREDHRQSDEHLNRFKGNVDRRDGAHNYGLLRAHKYHLELKGRGGGEVGGGGELNRNSNSHHCDHEDSVIYIRPQQLRLSSASSHSGHRLHRSQLGHRVPQGVVILGARANCQL